MIAPSTTRRIDIATSSSTSVTPASRARGWVRPERANEWESLAPQKARPSKTTIAEPYSARDVDGISRDRTRLTRRTCDPHLFGGTSFALGTPQAREPTWRLSVATRAARALPAER